MQLSGLLVLNQSISQSINQSINQPTNQPTSHITDPMEGVCFELIILPRVVKTFFAFYVTRAR